MRRSLSPLVLFLLVVAGPAFAQQVSPDAAIGLLRRFWPDPVTAISHCKGLEDLELLDPDALTESITEHGEAPWFEPPAGYKEIHFPGDARTYVMLWWVSEHMPVYWRLVRSTSSGDFELVQDSGGYYCECGSMGPVRPWFSLMDLDGDGVPEVILKWGRVSAVFVMKWDGAKLNLISPFEATVGRRCAIQGTYYSGICSRNNDIVFEDLDGDGKAEMIAYPDLENQRDPETNAVTGIGPVSPTRIYKLDATGVYKLWKEIPAGDPFPITVPGIAVVHPGTIPLSELSSPSQGQLRVFVSHPAGMTYTVDNFVQTAFTLDVNGTAFDFKKRWDNTKYPDLTKGNREWMGVPVRQAARPSQGVWNVNPDDPTYPSPDATMEFHFLGPYFELRIAKSALYPYLLQRATADFANDSSRTTTFVEVPISGKMKDGKLAAIGAIVCVKKTGAGQ